jgi:hypothetical protein
VNQAADALPKQVAAMLQAAERELRSNAQSATELAEVARADGDTATASRATQAAREAEAAADRIADLRKAAKSAGGEAQGTTQPSR